MEGQKQTRTVEKIKEKLNIFQFSRESSITNDDAIRLYENFDSFISKNTLRIQSAQKSDVINIITELTHYFNMALQLLPSLSEKSGDFLKFLELGVGIGGGEGGWQGFTIQFGFPSGVSFSLHFDA